MAPLRRGLTAVRRVVGVAAVLFLLGCAVFFYRAAPAFPRPSHAHIPPPTHPPVPPRPASALRVGPPAQCRRPPVRRQHLTLDRQLRPRLRAPARTPDLVRRKRRPFSWRTRSSPPSPSKPLRSEVRTAAEQTPSCGCSAGRAEPVAGLPVTDEDRPVRPVHRVRRVGAAGSVPASRAGPRLRREVRNLCAGDQGVTPVGQPRGRLIVSSLAKTMTLSKYL